MKLAICRCFNYRLSDYSTSPLTAGRNKTKKQKLTEREREKEGGGGGGGKGGGGEGEREGEENPNLPFRIVDFPKSAVQTRRRKRLSAHLQFF